jgi:hypothetical protein
MPIPPANIIDNLTATVVYDNGEPGCWLEMIANSPCLRVIEHEPVQDAGRQFPDGDRLALFNLSLHATGVGNV